MWMMGYNDGGDFNTIQDSLINGRKLRALVPRPATATTNAPCLNSRIHGADFLALNHHHYGIPSSEQNKRELSTQQVVVSSRWNPTPEQLQTLEELYRRGTRTPSAEQIQHITSQLRRYGKIEGKNVFYWFQNHKARERQKRRRQLESPSNNLELPDINIQNSDKKESQGVNRTVFEGEQTKNWASLTKSSTNTEKTSTKGSAKVTEAECKTDGWLQFDGAELQERRTLAERNATWHLMHLSCSSSSSSSLSPTNLILFNSSSSSTSSSSSSSATAAITVTTTPPSTLIHFNTNSLQNINIHSPQHHLITTSSAACRGGAAAAAGEAHTTLQLFPLGSRHHDNNVVECDCDKDDEEELSGGAAMDASNATPFQYFEFLPLKN